jgi:hypothetical protein
MYRIGKKIIRIDVSDCRADTPTKLKELISTCSDPDVEKRIQDFTQVFEIHY